MKSFEELDAMSAEELEKLRIESGCHEGSAQWDIITPILEAKKNRKKNVLRWTFFIITTLLGLAAVLRMR
jgi:hypothetical protein